MITTRNFKDGHQRKGRTQNKIPVYARELNPLGLARLARYKQDFSQAKWVQLPRVNQEIDKSYKNRGKVRRTENTRSNQNS